MKRVGLAALVLLLLLLAGAALVAALRPPPPTPEPAPEAPRTARTSRRHVQLDGSASSGGAQPAAAPDPETITAPESEPEPAAPLGRGRLRGLVLDAVDGKPVAGCELRLLHPTGRVALRTTTDAGGVYEFRDAPDGVRLVLSLSARRYLTGLCCDVVLPPYRLEVKDVRLSRSPIVTVTATAQPYRRPAAGVAAQLYLGGERSAAVEADEHGVVRLALPAFGDYALVLGGNAYARTAPIPLLATPGGGDLDLTADVHEGGVLEVVVEYPDKKPGPRALVVVRGAGMEPRMAETDKKGIAYVERLAPGIDYEVTAGYPEGSRYEVSGRTLARVKDGHQTRAQVVLRPIGTLTGVVLGSRGAGLAGADVTVLLRDGTRARSVRTASDGSFDLSGIAPGKVTLEIERRGYRKKRLKAIVEDGRVKFRKVRYEMEELPEAAVSGRVTDVAGEPVAGALVRAIPADRRSRTDAEGRYRITNLPHEEEQRLVVRARGHRLVADQRNTPPAVVPLSGRTLRMDLDVEKVAGPARTPRGLRPGVDADDTPRVVVTGRVEDARARPVAGARVVCGDGRATTDPEGRFRLAGVGFAVESVGVLPRLRVVPPPGLLVPGGTLLRELGDDEFELDAGTVVLDARPLALVDLSDARLGRGPVRVFSVASTHQDQFLGEITQPLTPRPCVSYDGTWIHLPPANAWKEDGRGRVFAGVHTTRGLVTAEAGWRLYPNADATLRPEIDERTARVSVSVPTGYDGGVLHFKLTASDHVAEKRGASAAAQAQLGDPFASVKIAGEFRVAVAKARVEVPHVPLGRWEVVLFPPVRSPLSRLRAQLDVRRPGKKHKLRMQ